MITNLKDVFAIRFQYLSNKYESKQIFCGQFIIYIQTKNNALCLWMGKC